jgi:hypothetical protein
MAVNLDPESVVVLEEWELLAGLGACWRLKR